MSKPLDLRDELTGVVLDYALSTPPSAKWLMCYGQPLVAGDAVTARLRAKLIADGNPYGADSAGNPMVPDARGRTTAGKDNMGGAAAGRLTSSGGGVNGAVLGATGGSQTHALTTAQMPSHNHGVSDPGHAHSVYDPGHAHYYENSTEFDGGGGSQYNNTATLRAAATTGAATTGVSIYSAATGISTQNNGSGNAHPITRPTLVVNYVIKT